MRLYSVPMTMMADRIFLSMERRSSRRHFLSKIKPFKTNILHNRKIMLLSTENTNIVETHVLSLFFITVIAKVVYYTVVVSSSPDSVAVLYYNRGPVLTRCKIRLKIWRIVYFFKHLLTCIKPGEI